LHYLTLELVEWVTNAESSGIKFILISLQKADLLITETFDAGGFGEHVLETLDHAWKYLLNKVMIF
jgi:hypothetical protein